MPPKLTQRMSAQDAAFLYLERPNAPLHIGSIGVYEGTIPYQRFLAHMDARMPQIPRYRQRAVFVPLSLAHPAWADDPGFDIRNHVLHVSLPSPGTDEQLYALCTQLFAPPLDRNKPLWEMYLIDGLEGGRTAILSKVHHCMVDGVSGIELLMAVLDISPEPAPYVDEPPWHPGPLPDATVRLTEAFWDNVDLQRQMLRELQQNVLDPGRPLRQAQDLFRALRASFPFLTTPAPRMPFSGPLSSARSAAFSEVSFVEIREIRTALGGTVNDVVLAILAGALRRYLMAHGIDVNGQEPRVAIPVNVRLEDESGALGNRVSAMLTSLPVGEENPAARLHKIQDHVNELKQENQPGTIELLMRLSSYTPAPLQALGGSMPVVNTMVNLICTNVPGPMIPLYSIGHLMLAHYPMVPLSLDMGLGAGVTSYNQRLYFGLMADPTTLPDIDRLKRFVDESFLELRAAAGVTPTDLPAFVGQTNHQPVTVVSSASEKV
jgi:diacylglycerol O-acyltransferase